MTGSFRVVAIIAAYNEEDIIGQALTHLVDQGASVYLLDDGSTDRTVELARGFLGRGLLTIEPLSRPGTDEQQGRFSLAKILRRKEDLAQEIEADWFINHDADEFRDSPWPHLTLCEAIALVDRLGWNAVDFEVLNFRPLADEFRPGDNPGRVFRHYEPPAEYDRVQVRCWRRTQERVDLASTAGHDVQFPGRRVFPIRFPMRHYPIRSAVHGARKVFAERKPRFDPDEQARGWHVQYEGLVEAGSFTRDAASLAVYDRDAVNVGVQLQNRLVDAACPPPVAGVQGSPIERVQRVEAEIARRHAAAEGSRTSHERAVADNERLAREAASRAEEVQQLLLALEQRARDIQVHRSALDESERRLGEALAVAAQLRQDIEACKARLDHVGGELERLEGDAASVARRLGEVLSSRSWRITAPLRALWRLLGGT